MRTVKYTCWKDGDFYLGYLNDYPEYQTQGMLKEELIANLQDLRNDIEMKEEYDFTDAEQGKFYRPLEELEIKENMDMETTKQDVAGGGNIFSGSGNVTLLFSPENVAMIVSLVSAAIGAGTVAVKAIQLWVDERKSRKIKIKCKDIELEISGAVSEKEILKKLEMFNKIEEKVKKEEVEIILIDGNKPLKLS
jgi:hypothetical protein